ncbi:MAG: tryptophan 7-halogenase [Caulobacterales bacterium]|nr:tryptophan 7-halogenase [Caulobacterales bacterium]
MTRIVIVGGGTAGWLTAAYLTAQLQHPGADEPRFTLIESSDIPTIGVGEATTPSIRDTLAGSGVDEARFLRACDATFKHGIRFVNWTHAPQDDPSDHYFHPFERPLRVGLDHIAGYWLAGLDPYRRPFADAVSIQQELSIRNLAPKRAGDPSYAGPVPYAYHLDAGKLAELLKTVSRERGVAHMVGTVQSVETDPAGDIAALALSDGRRVEGDLFIDCTGFAALLIEKHYGAPFNDLTGVLFCDRAVTCRVPYEEGDAVIRPYTTATAQSAGWIWDIGLAARRGVGHVYSSRHIGDEAAVEALKAYVGPQADEAAIRSLRMRVGYRDRQWVKNCIAIGLSGGFVEPLESTGIHLVEVALAMLVQMIPRYVRGGSPQERFCEVMKNQYDVVVDFVKLHYFLSRRSDSAFWIENVAEASATEELAEKVKAWESGYPSVYDLRFIHSIFDHLSYQYVYFGMDRRPAEGVRVGDTSPSQAVRVFENVRTALTKAVSVLPDHRQCVEQIASR